MQSENQRNQVKPNPSRYNKNIKQGQNDEKSFGGKNNQVRSTENDSGSQVDNHEVSLDRGRVSDTKSHSTHQYGTGAPKDNEQSRKQTQSQGFQNSQGASGSKTAESGSVEIQNVKAGSGSGYDANEQFDEDEDFGSHGGGLDEQNKNQDQLNSDRQ